MSHNNFDKVSIIIGVVAQKSKLAGGFNGREENSFITIRIKVTEITLEFNRRPPSSSFAGFNSFNGFVNPID